MKFERYRLEYQDEYTKRKQLDAITTAQDAIEGERKTAKAAQAFRKKPRQ